MKSFDGTPIATIINTATRVPFTMRLVRKGDGYGRNLALIHDKDEPLVEFYDARHGCERVQEKGGEYGQFVSRYYVSTILDRHTAGEGGLCLEGSVASWTIDGCGMRHACRMLEHWTA